MEENKIIIEENADAQPQQIETDIKKQRRERKLTIFLLMFAICTLLFNTFVMQLARVSGSSMSPTLENGQMLVVSKLNNDNGISKGEIIVFKHDGRFFIKRVIATPGDSVQIVDNDIYINDIKTEDYVNIEMEDIGVLSKKITLKANEYIVLGDNRNNSIDSRNFGIVNGEDIIGKVILRISPFTKY